MNIEDEIFKKSKVNIENLKAYGFKENVKGYIYSKDILDGSLKVIIEVSNNGKVNGKVFDNSFGDEYTIFRIETQTGSFVGSVKEEFEKILLDIKNKCFYDELFIYPQTNRITRMIKNSFDTDPEFEWEKFEGFGTFRNKTSDKWYALIMNLDRSKLEDSSGEIEILNIKLPEDKIKLLLDKKGFYPAYHMNKKYWITISLDETISDKEIFDLISISYNLTSGNKLNSSQEWIVPANPKYFDVCNAFDEKDINLWKQSTNINVGDIVYIYVGAPISALMYRCEVLKTNIPYTSKNVHMTHAMEVKVLNRFQKSDYPFSKIKSLGVPSIRGPRHISKELSMNINSFIK